LKIKYFLLLLIILSSCKDDISNGKFRNENYVFYQENEKAGEWLKINPELEIKPPKSHSTYFFPNGSRYVELEIIDSFPNRIIKFFNKEDKLIRTTKYKSDSIVNTIYENGYYKGYHSNIGLLQSEGLIENHMFQGKWKFYRKDGETIKQIVEYINDTLHGIRKDYWENGNLKSTATNIKGKQNGETFHYFETGELEETNFLKNSELHGPMKHFFKNGKIEYVRKYWNGKRKDTCITYYENGKTKRLQINNLDTLAMKVSGKEYVYYESGELKAVVDFKDYTANGNLIIYSKKGVIIESSEKRNNKHQGAFITYYDSGIKQLEGKINNGYYNGKLNYFDKKGKRIKTVNYDAGTALDSIMY
jgi:antitoxin component YwqK of YwqJK toxin-antitoxin module